MAMDRDPVGAATVQHQPQHQGVREDLQIGPFARGVEIGHGGAAADPVALGDLEAADPHLRGTVEIVVGAVT